MKILDLPARIVILPFTMGHGLAIALLSLASATRPVVGSPSPQTLHQLVSLFPHGEVVVASGRRSLAAAMGEVLQSIARQA